MPHGEREKESNERNSAGTLTLNKLSVDASTVLCLGGHTVDDVLKMSALSSQIDSEEAIDVVLVESYHGKELSVL